MHGVTAFDILVGLVVGLCFIVALVRGFTTLALGFAAWIGAALVALYAFTPVSGIARDYISPPQMADIVTVPVLFVTSLVLLKLLASALGNGVRSSSIGFLDRSLGGLAGLIFGITLVSLAYLGLSALIRPDDQPDWIQQARLRPLVSYGADLVADMGPELSRRAARTDPGKKVIRKHRETLPQLEDAARAVTEPLYEEGQRRAMDQLVDQLEESNGDQPPCDREKDPDCDKRDGTK